LIAEAWDAGGLYQVGDFPGYRWLEWNGRYRDLMRRFVRGDSGHVSELATRVLGSSDLYQSAGRLPINSINFVTCHDGFTLNDLLSYSQKRNHDNGEDNRDGTNDNLSWNCGAEGGTGDGNVLTLRKQLAKNFLAILLTSHGVPMLLAGDEVLRTQRGNNNAYCQDNELSWFDWNLTETHQDMLRFTREMIAFRKRHPCLMRRRYLTGKPIEGRQLHDVNWHGDHLNQPLWDDPQSQLLVYTLAAAEPDEEDVHLILNMSDDYRDLRLPALEGRTWHRAVDTASPSPSDILHPPDQPPLPDHHYAVNPRTVVILEARPT
jgi:glycogen operon protein